MKKTKRLKADAVPSIFTRPLATSGTLGKRASPCSSSSINAESSSKKRKAYEKRENYRVCTVAPTSSDHPGSSFHCVCLIKYSNIDADKNPKIEYQRLSSSMAMTSECNAEILQLSEVGRSSFQKSTSLRILITGRTGVGKSALVNSIIGKVVAPESANPPDPETLEVTSYCDTILGVETVVYDSPGLQDGINNEEAYLKDLERKCKNVNLIVYCVKMTDAMSDGEILAISKLSNAFGMDDFWRNGLFALTFANKIELPQNDESCTQQSLSEYFENQVAGWRAKLHEALISERVGVGQEITKKVPIIPAGYRNNLSLPNVKYWLSDLWYQCLARMDEIAKPALLKINWDRLRASQEVQEEDMQHSQLIVFTRDTVGPFLKAVGGYFSNMSSFIGTGKAKLEEVIPKLRSVSLTLESHSEHSDQDQMSAANKRHTAPTTLTGTIGKVFGCFGAGAAVFTPEAMSMHEATDTESQMVDELQEDCATGMQESISQDRAAVSNTAGSIETPDPGLDDRPTLKLLQCLKTADGKDNLNIVKRLGTKWYDVGIQLNFDDDGTEVETIAKKHLSDPNACCMAMFRHWLKGNGEPCSWHTLIEVIEDCDLKRLAEDIQDLLNS